MAAKKPTLIRISDIVVTDDGLKAMMLKIDEKIRKSQKSKREQKKFGLLESMMQNA